MHKFSRARLAIQGLRLALASLLLLPAALVSAFAQGEVFPFQTGPTGVIVHSQFGGQIFGFDIDQNGTEGLLTEAKTVSGGRVVAAVGHSIRRPAQS